MFKKNVPMMYLAGNSPIKFLEEVVCTNMAPSFPIKWSTRHLVEVDMNIKEYLFYECIAFMDTCTTLLARTRWEEALKVFQ